jgi:hypothetical protein
MWFGYPTKNLVSIGGQIMLNDYVFLAVVAAVGFGGGFYLLEQAKKYRRTRDQEANKD